MINNKLDVWKVVSGAFLIPWESRATFGIALANPVFLIAILMFSWSHAKTHVPAWLAWGLYLAYLMLFTMLAITCHRLVLLKLTNVNSHSAFHWSLRETRFFGCLIVIMIFSFLIKLILIPLMSIIFLFFSSSPLLPKYITQSVC
jgi:hypothetical protein